MTILDTIRHALGNLRRQRLRTILTCLGIAVGVTTTAIMMALPAGVNRMLAAKLDRQDLVTTIFVLERPFPLSFAELQRQMRHFEPGKSTSLDDDLVADLRKIPGVVTVYPFINLFVTCEAVDEKIAELQGASGIPQDGITEGLREAILAGSWWNAQATHNVCVLPASALAKFGFATADGAVGKKLFCSPIQAYYSQYAFDPPLQDELAPGQVRRCKRPDDLKGIELTITGVFDPEKAGAAGNGLIVPLEQARGIASEAKGPFRLRDGRYHQIVVKAVDRQHVDEIRKQLAERKLGTLMTADLLGFLNVILGVIQAGLGVFGGIALFVAFFGIANTMVMAVLERTREIGILKALGGRDRDVWFSFVVEASSIGLLGGAAGIATGVLVCHVLNWAANKAGASFDVFYISLWLGGGLIAFATGVALVAGLYPAWRASRLDPVEALRRE
ncbi:ABC transporter permease [bacterium]|nr:ABC transporter permease [bacterium]